MNWESIRVHAAKGLGYRDTVAHLWRRRGPAAAANFAFVKLFVMEGEGSWGLVSRSLEWALRGYPMLKPRLVPYPFNVEMEITTVCDKKCRICEHTYWKGYPKRHLTRAEFDRIVSQFPFLRWVNLTGEGDAFLNPDYLDMIRELKRRHVSVYLVDSFDLVDEAIATQLVDADVEGVWVSMDGATKRTYEQLKQGCSFDRVLENLRRILALKARRRSPIPEISFRFIVTTLNVHEMPAFVDLIASLGGRAALGPGSKIEFAGLLEFPDIRDLAISEIPAPIIEETRARARRHDLRITFAHASKAGLPPLERCVAWMEPYIMMGGYALPCCAVLQNNDRTHLMQHALGNLLTTDFREIWYSERYRRMRDIITRRDQPVPILCRGCRAFDSGPRLQRYGMCADV